MHLLFAGSEYAPVYYTVAGYGPTRLALMTIAGKLIIRDINVKNIATAVVVSTLILLADK